MLNVLLFCKQVETSKKLLNQIIGKIPNFRLIGIATTIKESTNIMKEIEPNIIITTESSISDLLNKKFITYRPGIILITNQNYSTRKDNILILDFQLTFAEMTKKILRFTEKNIGSTYREKVINTLLNLKFNFNLTGTKFILEAILYVHSYKGSYSFEKLRRDVYTYIAKTNSTTENKVKWSIERSINYMYKSHTPETYKVVENFFGTKYPQKPTPKLLISMFVNKTDI